MADGHFGKLVLGLQDPAWWARLGKRQLVAGEERCSPRTLLSSKPVSKPSDASLRLIIPRTL